MDTIRGLTAVLRAAAVCMAVARCATPVSSTPPPTTASDQGEQASIEERDDGFDLTVNYSTYQFIADGNAVATSCRSQAAALAYEHAESQGRDIEPIDEQGIRISLSRDEVAGITSCEATATATWE